MSILLTDGDKPLLPCTRGEDCTWGLRLETGQDKAPKGAGKEYVYEYMEFWACGCAITGAERTAAQSEDAVFWRRHGVFKRRLLFWETKNNIFFPQSHPAIDVPSYLRANWMQHHLSFAQMNTKVCAYQTALASAAIPAPWGPPWRHRDTSVHFSILVPQNLINNTRNRNGKKKSQDTALSDCNTNTPVIQLLLALSTVFSNGDRQVKYDKPMAWSLSPWVSSDDKCSSELLLRRLHDNGQSTGF